MRHFCCFALATVFVVMPAAAQEFRGTMSGSVTDPTGATVVGAKVAATETSTGTKVQSVADSSGLYTLPFLQPGNYDLSVQAPGFKESIRKAIHVGSG